MSPRYEIEFEFEFRFVQRGLGQPIYGSTERRRLDERARIGRVLTRIDKHIVRDRLQIVVRSAWYFFAFVS